MNKRILFLFLIIPLSLIAVYSCIDFDYFSKYKGKNLISHTALSDWSPSQNNTYMIYEPVTAAAAGGTAGLPDASAQIYRLENKNLLINGDFEESTVGSPPGGAWTFNPSTPDPCPASWEIRNSGPLDGNSLFFDLNGTQYISYPINALNETDLINNSYVIRFSLAGCGTSDIIFLIEDRNIPVEKKFSAAISTPNTAYKFPEDFKTIPQTDFSIYHSDNNFFRINSPTEGRTFSGIIDNIRIVRANLKQELSIFVPYSNEAGTDSVELISGCYRFSMYVKKDPTSGTGNRFLAEELTLTIETINKNGESINSKGICAFAYDHSSFSDWTEISVNANLMIEKPEDKTQAVIKLSISPCCTKMGAKGIDAGSILISNPSLEFSESGF